MIKLTIKIVLFSLIFVLITKTFLDPIFKKTNSFESSINEIYALDKDSIDVLILGSSHARNSFNPAIIDQSLNINSYSLASGGQRLVVTNNLLEDILKEVKPKLLILDVFPGSLDYPKLPPQKSNQLQVFDHSKWTFNKLKFVISMYPSNELPSILSPTIRNHEHWNTANWKFKSIKLDSTRALFIKGFSGSYAIIDDKERSKFLDYKEKKKKYPTLGNKKIDPSKFTNELLYVKKVIEISKRYNVELLIVSAPYFNAFYNPQGGNFHFLIKQLCKSSKIKFLDFNSKFNELGLNMNDFRDKAHVNISGADKVTNSLVKYLLDKKYFQIDEKDANNIDQTLKSLSNKFELVYEEKINKEILPTVFATQVSISKNKELYQIILKLNKKKGAEKLIKKYNLEYVATVYEEDKKLLKGNSKKEVYTFYNAKVISIDAEEQIIFRIPKSEIVKYKNIKIYSFLKGKKLTSKKFSIDLKDINLENIIFRDKINFQEDKNNIDDDLFNKLNQVEKILTQPFQFNKAIVVDEIGYINEHGSKYTFIFKISKNSNYNDVENFTGYLKYYNGEIKEQNKHVNSFPVKLLEVDGDKYIFETINVDNIELSKLDIFFIKKEPKKISKFYIIKDLKLKKNTIRQ